MSNPSDYNLFASAPTYTVPSFSAQYGSMTHSAQMIGRAVPSYSTHITGNSIPTYLTHLNVSAHPSYAYSSAVTRTIRQAPIFENHSLSSVPEEVPLNQDPNPIIIKKKPTQPVNYTQQVSVKFLKPPPPEPAGDIIIQQEQDTQAPPAPPKHIVERPPEPVKPAPLIIRERPPAPPAPIPPEHHVIPGKVLPPPPRKIITERLPSLPQPPQDIIVERWLEYGPRTRRVLFQPAPKLILAPAPKNVRIEWESPDVALQRQFRNLGVTPAHPAEYMQRYGPSLVHASAIPAIARGVRPSGGLVLAEESAPKQVQLVGDVGALSLINKSHVSTQAVVSAPKIVDSTAAQAPAITVTEETATFVNFPNDFPPSSMYTNGHAAPVSSSFNAGSVVVQRSELAAGSGFINASGSAFYDY